MSNRYWQVDKINIADLTDDALQDILDEVAKIDPALAKRLTGLNWKSIAVSLAKDALKAAAAKVNGQYQAKGPDRNGHRFLASINRGGTVYALYQAEDGSLKAECFEYDFNGGRERNEIRQAFEAEYGVAANRAIIRLLSTDGQVQSGKQQDGQVIMSAEVEVN